MRDGPCASLNSPRSRVCLATGKRNYYADLQLELHVVLDVGCEVLVIGDGRGGLKAHVKLHGRLGGLLVNGEPSALRVGVAVHFGVVESHESLVNRLAVAEVARVKGVGLCAQRFRDLSITINDQIFNCIRSII